MKKSSHPCSGRASAVENKIGLVVQFEEWKSAMGLFTVADALQFAEHSLALRCVFPHLMMASTPGLFLFAMGNALPLLSVDGL